MSGKETLNFQTEVTRLLDLMIHSLYSNKEIFLRELISNASDAADKLRFEAATDDALYEGDADLHVFVDVDKKARTITVRDNGIGMSREEVIEHIGTIARSGTRAFIEHLTGDREKDAHLIGQFGVGFYSAFLVADRVVLTTRRAGLTPEHGVRWESAGDGSYTVETIEKAERGTEITLHLREDADEFLDPWRLRSIIRKYADHIPFPIRMKKSPDADEVETVNQASALWTRPKSELKDEDYVNFYRHIGHDFADPLAWMHQKLEGKFEYTLLFYIPREAPFDLWHADARHGVKLYVRRVYIMDADEKILPRWLRFLRGVMDSNDLPLNVSREMLQESPAMQAMKKGATKRVLSWLESIARDKPEDYATFWNAFGNCLKEGVIEDFAYREAIAKLLRFASTSSDEQKVSLSDYVQRMKEGQKAIYYITADTLAAAKNSPHLEIFRAKDVEVLLLHDRIDEWLVGALTEFDGKPLQSVAKGEIDLSDIGGDEERKQEEEARKEAEKSAEQAVKRLKEALGGRVKDVRPTHRLTESPACLVSDAYDISNNMERILKQLGQQAPEHKPILEINPGHPLVKRLAHMRDKNKLNELALVLFDQAVLAEGALPEDPAGFVRRVNALLTKERS